VPGKVTVYSRQSYALSHTFAGLTQRASPLTMASGRKSRAASRKGTMPLMR
jgi:hypothetical protein